MVANEGRVEFCYEGVWGTITSIGWGDMEARLVCKQLGYFPYCKFELHVSNIVIQLFITSVCNTI